MSPRNNTFESKNKYQNLDPTESLNFDLVANGFQINGESNNPIEFADQVVQEDS
jgi:hypothetical protein